MNGRKLDNDYLSKDLPKFQSTYTSFNSNVSFKANENNFPVLKDEKKKEIQVPAEV
jgi:hypothetical protein